MFHVIAVVIKMKFELIEVTDLQNNLLVIDKKSVLLVIHQNVNQSSLRLANLQVEASLPVLKIQSTYYQIIVILQLNRQDKEKDTEQENHSLNRLPFI
jgi:hypothetical protein